MFSDEITKERGFLEEEFGKVRDISRNRSRIWTEKKIAVLGGIKTKS
jgi:hypothetical protein